MPPDLSSVAPDLVIPAVEDGPPAAGRRVRAWLPRHAGSRLYHALHLPPGWPGDRRWPVIVEYAGNGPYADGLGDTCSGRLEDARLGFGLCGGAKAIWVNLPYVAAGGASQQLQWWGDREATVAYCVEAVAAICRDFAGDPGAVVLCGFSRGAIACNHIGLADERIAALWRASIAHSHYDGVRRWDFPGDDEASAIARLRRLRGRPQFISHENDVGWIRDWVLGTGVAGDFTFRTSPFRNHSDAWILRPTPLRDELRRWLERVVPELRG